MGSARIAVFLVALVMMGVHVAQAQEGTGNPTAFTDAQRIGPRARAATVPSPVAPQPSPAALPSQAATTVAVSNLPEPRPVLIRPSTVAAPKVTVTATSNATPSVTITAAQAPAPSITIAPAKAPSPTVTITPMQAADVPAPSAPANSVMINAAPTRPAPVAPSEPLAAAAVEPVAPPKPVITLVANVDLSSQRLTVTANGVKVHSWPISSGTREFPTPVGNFKAEWQAKLWYSKKYDDAPMPHAVFFKDGAAIHATQSTGSLGRPASHGCVRLAPGNAETFYKLVQKHGLKQSRIVVHGTPKFAPAVVARASSQVPFALAPQRAYGQMAMPYPYGTSSYPAQSSARVWPGDAPIYRTR